MTRFRKPSKKTICLGLLLLAGITIILPPGWTGRLSALTQVLAPAQHATNGLVDFSSDKIRKAFHRPVPYQHHKDALDRLERLERELASASEALRQLQSENRELTGLREKGFSGNITLVPARVIAVDPAAWRDVRMINKGFTRSVSQRDWVASHRTVVPSQEAALSPAMPVLSGQALIGHIEEANPFNSRLVLLSDVSIDRMPVRLVPGDNSRPKALDAQFMLRGKGSGRIELYDVSFQYVQNRQIQIGDYVVTTEETTSIPIPMTIGRISTIERTPEQPLLYRCEVTPPLDYADLRKVYVVQVSTPTNAPKG